MQQSVQHSGGEPGGEAGKHGTALPGIGVGLSGQGGERLGGAFRRAVGQRVDDLQADLRIGVGGEVAHRVGELGVAKSPRGREAHGVTTYGGLRVGESGPQHGGGGFPPDAHQAESVQPGVGVGRRLGQFTQLREHFAGIPPLQQQGGGVALPAIGAVEGGDQFCRGKLRETRPRAG